MKLGKTTTVCKIAQLDFQARSAKHRESGGGASWSGFRSSLDTDSLEDIEPGESCADDHPRDLRMPVTLLDISLALMYKQQLGRYIHLLVLGFSIGVSF